MPPLSSNIKKSRFIPSQSVLLSSNYGGAETPAFRHGEERRLASFRVA